MLMASLELSSKRRGDVKRVQEQLSWSGEGKGGGSVPRDVQSRQCLLT